MLLYHQLALTQLTCMKQDSVIPTTIDDFISNYPAAIQTVLETLRSTIRKAAPDATEKISYAIPTFYLQGNLVHFSAYKNHIGFYPGASGIEIFHDELSAYKTSKGTVQFPVDKPLPLALITKIVKYRVKQNLEKAGIKAQTKSKSK